MLSTKLGFQDALKPICALCRKEVERMELMYPSRVSPKRDTTIILVYCHGKRREFRIDNSLIYNGTLHRGVAFVDELYRMKKLTQPEVDETLKQIQQQFQIEHKPEREEK